MEKDDVARGDTNPVVKGYFPVSVELDAGSVGLALTYASTLMGMFQWAVRQSAEVENLVTFTIIIKYKMFNLCIQVSNVSSCGYKLAVVFR